MQLKIKPSMIIQEMQNDKDFMKSTRHDPNTLDGENRLRKRTITDKDFKKITHKSVDTDNINPRTVKRKHGKADMIMAEGRVETPPNLRLDSRINPRKSIVLDISIMDQKQGGAKSVKHRNSQYLNDKKYIFVNNIIGQIKVEKLCFPKSHHEQNTQPRVDITRLKIVQ
jgi:hypothetical protein